MLPYWLLFGYFAAAVILSSSTVGEQEPSRPLLAFGALVIAVIIGFRWRVGGDWAAYERMFAFAGQADLAHVIGSGDPGYEFLNWLVQQTGCGIWLVNLICGLIFSWGLLRLVSTQPDPWLGILVAVPYLIVVVAMGYSRQSLSIGILMAAFADLSKGGSVIRFVVSVAIASLFHRTAIVALPLGVATGSKSIFINVVLVISVGTLLYDSFVASSMDRLFKDYISDQYSSQGAVIRVAQSLVPAMFFFIKRKSLGFSTIESKVWRNFSLAALGCFVALGIFPSSTVVDRLALYLIPLQIVILPRLCGQQFAYRVITVSYAATVLFIWLNFAVYAVYWIPYRFY